MWLEENIGKRVNMERTEEALGTGADVVSTACPYCMIMLDDAVRANAKEDDVRVLDLSQLLEESMGDPVSVGAPDIRYRVSAASTADPLGADRGAESAELVVGHGVRLTEPGGQCRQHLAGDGGHRLEQPVELTLGQHQDVHARSRRRPTPSGGGGRAGPARRSGRPGRVWRPSSRCGYHRACRRR